MALSPDKYNLRKNHPAVQGYPYVKTSEKDSDYNCFAYVAGVFNVNWCPHVIKRPGYDWPVDKSDLDENNIQTYLEGYATLGYVQCMDASLEDGYEKIAIYVNEKNEPEHAAIQREDGSWQSKLGKNIDIRHELQCLETSDEFGISTYGRVGFYMKRMRQQ